MKVKNTLVDPLFTFLHKLELSGKACRMKVRFMKLLQAQFKVIQEEQKQLLEEYALKDNENQPIKKEANGKVEYELEFPEKYQEEMNVLLNEELVIEENETNREMLLSVAESVLNFDKPLSGHEAIQWDMFCEIFESLNYEEK